MIELAAGELTRVKAQHGNRSIFGGSYGWASAGRFYIMHLIIFTGLSIFLAGARSHGIATVLRLRQSNTPSCRCSLGGGGNLSKARVGGSFEMKPNYSLRLEVFLSEIRRSPTVVLHRTQ